VPVLPCHIAGGGDPTNVCHVGLSCRMNLFRAWNRNSAPCGLEEAGRRMCLPADTLRVSGSRTVVFFSRNAPWRPGAEMWLAAITGGEAES
jgi:hypothetical protein